MIDRFTEGSQSEIFVPFRVVSFAVGHTVQERKQQSQKSLFKMAETQRNVSIQLNPFSPTDQPDTCANSVAPDETAHDEPSHQDLHSFFFFFF